MLANKAAAWVESYLYRACGNRALEQSVFAEGERQGFSERKLRKAGASLGVRIDSGCWELHPARVAALDLVELTELAVVPELDFGSTLERRVA